VIAPVASSSFWQIPPDEYNILWGRYYGEEVMGSPGGAEDELFVGRTWILLNERRIISHVSEI
jgi:hypothetical protein